MKNNFRKNMSRFAFFSFVIFLAFTLVQCHKKEKVEKMVKQNISLKSIDQNIRNGNFSIAHKEIQSLTNDPNTSDKIKIELRFKKDLMRRINLDFCRDEQFVRDKLAKYYPKLTDEMLLSWEASKALEMRIIDGEKRYFYNAVPNLFRLDSEAMKIKKNMNGDDNNELKAFRQKHTSELIKQYNVDGNSILNPVKMKLTYTLTVDADAVPAGETIRCWMPFPREDSPRQKEVKLLSTNVNDYIISPEEYKQRSLYMEKVVKAGEPTKFEMEVTYKAFGQYSQLKNVAFEKYDTSSEFYKKYTSEKAPHIVFSKRIKDLTEQLTAGINNPYEKVKRIYTWIDNTTPWASALEYSTFWNIPKYVLDNKHGDCGMQSLLFITMARYAGIPAKWQSGWMVHPGHVNLHDWAEVYYPEIGWVPVDESFSLQNTDDPDVKYFYTNGIDSYRLIINDDISTEFYPQKIFPRSETVDFQRGEVEWRGGNLYFDKWNYHMDVKYLKN